MKHATKAPKGSWLDNNGKRWIKQLFDVMNGDKFVRQISMPLAMHFDLQLARYVVELDTEKLRQEVVGQYPSLLAIKDVRFLPTSYRV